jgi:hypothetical protein
MTTLLYITLGSIVFNIGLSVIALYNSFEELNDMVCLLGVENNNINKNLKMILNELTKMNRKN